MRAWNPIRFTSPLQAFLSCSPAPFSPWKGIRTQLSTCRGGRGRENIMAHCVSGKENTTSEGNKWRFSRTFPARLASLVLSALAPALPWLAILSLQRVCFVARLQKAWWPLCSLPLRREETMTRLNGSASSITAVAQNQSSLTYLLLNLRNNFFSCPYDLRYSFTICRALLL